MNISHKEIQSSKEKQIAPRHKVNLSGSVIITVVSHLDTDTESYLILHGRLLDVSRTGLALIISETDMQELDKLNNEMFFRLLLPLPAEAIELEAIPVRYQQVEPVETGEWLIGANITNMNGRDRIVFMEFIHQFEEIEPTKVKARFIGQGDFDPNNIIGMDVYTAYIWVKQHGHSVRVIRKNGSECLVQRNQDPKRINVATQDDVIIEILDFG